MYIAYSINITLFRYLLSVNSHGVVTCTLDFLTSLVKRLPLFSILYMKILVDKLENISLDKVMYSNWLNFVSNLNFSYLWIAQSLPSQIALTDTARSLVPMKTSKVRILCLISSCNMYSFQGPYKLAKKLMMVLESKQ